MSKLGSETKNLDSGLHKLAKSLLNLWNSDGVSGTLERSREGRILLFFWNFPQPQEQAWCFGKGWRGCAAAVWGADASPCMVVAGDLFTLTVDLTPSFGPKQRSKHKGLLQFGGSGVVWFVLLVREPWTGCKAKGLLSRGGAVPCLQPSSTGSVCSVPEKFSSCPHRRRKEAKLGCQSSAGISISAQGAPATPWSHLNAFEERAANSELCSLPPTPPQIPHAPPCVSILQIFPWPLLSPKRRMLNLWPHPQSTQTVRWLGEVKLFLGEN